VAGPAALAEIAQFIQYFSANPCPLISGSKTHVFQTIKAGQFERPISPQERELGVFHSAMEEKRRDWMYLAQVPIKARR
jgi:hypothetical protein